MFSILKLFIQDPFYSQDRIAQRYALHILTSSVFKADEQRLYYLGEADLMTTFAWRLSIAAHDMHSILHGNEEGQLPSLFEVTNQTQMIAETVLNKEDIVRDITDSIVDSIVSDVVRQVEETKSVVEQTVATMIDIFLDKTQESKEHSLENQILVNEVVDEMIDGIVNVVCQPAPTPIAIEPSMIDQLKDAGQVSELLILAIAILITVGFL